MQITITEKQHEAQPLLTSHGIIILPTEINEETYFQMNWVLTYARSIHPERPLELRCHGNGGSAPVAFSIAELIHADGNIDGVLAGFAFSGNTIIWAACARRWIYPNSYLGVHQVRQYQYEYMTVQTHKHESYQLERMNIDMARIYATASNKDKGWWTKQLNSATIGAVILDADTLINKLEMALPIAEKPELPDVETPDDEEPDDNSPEKASAEVTRLTEGAEITINTPLAEASNGDIPLQEFDTGDTPPRHKPKKGDSEDKG